MDDVLIRESGAGDRAAIRALLEEAGLPVPGPADAPVHFLLAEQGGRAIATSGWELHRGEALLRSVAVAGDARRRGIGARLVGACLDALDHLGAHGITLVTLEAGPFFGRFGFAPIAREDVPEPIRDTTEYRIHECAGGTWMHRGGAADASRTDPR